MTRVLVASVLAGALVAAGHAQSQSDSSRIPVTGRVSAADTGDPLVHARVVVYQDAVPLAPIFTDGQGRFAAAVAPGRYRLTAQKAGYAPATINAIDVASRAPIDVRMTRSAAITGRVIDRFGEPAASVIVSLFGPPKPDLTADGPLIKRITTDDLGEYRFGGLPEGAYIVAATSPQVNPSTLQMDFAPTYFPGVTTLRDAQPLVLLPGDERGGIDFAGLSSQPSQFTVNSQIVLQNNVLLVGSQNTPIVPKPVVGNGVIRGRVTRSDGLPIAHASVTTRALESLPFGQQRPGIRLVYTDEDGMYELPDLPPGSYRITAAKLGFTSTVYGQRPDETVSVINQPRGSAIELADGQIKTRVDIALPRYSAITGRVLDEFGDPVEDVTVAVSEIRFQAGRRRLVGAPGIVTRATDDRGRYRLYGLLPGDYIVNAAPGQVVPNQTPSSLSGYAPSYFPGTPNPREAELVPVGRSQDATGIDFVLVPTRTASISGKKLGSDGQPMGGSLMLMESQRSGAIITPAAGARIQDDGRFEFPNVAPGDYVIQADHGTVGPGLEGDFVAQYVTVNGNDITDLLLQSEPGSTITGHVVFDGDGPPPSLRSLAIVPDRADLDRTPNRGSIATGDVASDLSFRISGVHGPRRIGLRQPPPGWDLKAVLANGIEVTDMPIRFGTPDQSLGDVQVILTNRLTELTATATDARDRPTNDFVLLLFPQDRDRWYTGSRYFRRVPAQPAGYVLVQGLPPADYFIAAIPREARVLRDGPDAWEDPDYLESIAQRAIKETLTEGQKLSVSAKVITP